MLELFVILAAMVVGAALVFFVLGGIGRVFNSGGSEAGCLFTLGTFLLVIAVLLVLLGLSPV